MERSYKEMVGTIRFAVKFCTWWYPWLKYKKETIHSHKKSTARTCLYPVQLDSPYSKLYVKSPGTCQCDIWGPSYVCLRFISLEGFT